VIVHFVDIGEIVEHHCLNLFFIMYSGKQLTHYLSDLQG